MHSNLFQLASLAIVGWIPLIVFPTWSGFPSNFSAGALESRLSR
jgi:hypothetical protein